MAFGFDSALSAFLRQMGVQEQGIYAEARQRSDVAQRQYARSIPMYQEQEREAVENVQNDAEARGVYRSGATARNTALARNAVALRQNEALALSQDAQDAYALDAARRIADLRRQTAEQELAARSNAALKAASSAYGG
jgi:hypothetical protein